MDQEDDASLAPSDLDDDDYGQSMPLHGHDTEREPWLVDETRPNGRHPPSIFTTVHRVRQLVLRSIDDPYTLNQLTSPRVNTLVVRPLVDRLYNPDDSSIVYCVLANRVQFLREQSTPVHQSVSLTRAMLCELVATRLLGRFHEEDPSSMGLLLLSGMLVEGFDPFAGAPEEVQRSSRQIQWPVQQRGGHERKLTALELAIISESKIFIASQACRRVVNAIYEGQVVYTPLSFVDILPDHYKYRPITLYDPRRAPVLNHYRLIVPRWRNIMETIQFVVLVVLYFLAMVNRDGNMPPPHYEAVFVIYGAGWVLDEFASIIEHGWAVHSQNLWSFLDLTFTLIYVIFVCARLFDTFLGDQVDSGVALPALCLAAPILLTRLAFNLMPDNIVFISIHAMMKSFLMLTFLAIWCVAGFFLALQWLVPTQGSEPDDAPKWYTVTKWLLWIWFGLDGTGIEESVRFHTVLGPTLMISFAFLGNTLFLTILVALLTNTFSTIVQAEAAEIEFRRAVLTFEGVKSDAIFAYPPPFNVIALAILLPLKLLVSQRSFHSIHVAMARVLNFPLLILIHLYERQFMWPRSSMAKNTKSFLHWNFTGFSPHGDIYAVFEADPPPSAEEEAESFEGLSEMGFSENDVISRSNRRPRKPPPQFRLGRRSRTGSRRASTNSSSISRRH